MSIWEDIGAIYDRPGVKALCLKLQDEHGQCVSYLLWAGWAARQGRFVAPAGLADCARLARWWDWVALKPQRRMFRPVRAILARIGAPADLALQLLLAPERLLLHALDARSPAVGVNVTVPEALACAVKAWPGSAPAELLAELASAFSRR